jgi:hypothetical protein
MYEALDAFTNVDTWTSLHWADEERFYRALGLIVGNQGFTSQGVHDYIERKYTEQFGTSDVVRQEAKRQANHYAERAEIIARFLRATR